MTTTIRAAFEFDAIVIALNKLLYTKQVGETLRQTPKYRTILASVREIGVIEPLIVHLHKGDRYLLLDGHVRAEVLKELDIKEALCLNSTDDEGYTYNQKVNRVAPIQANRMILKALQAGVPEERIARALNISLTTVRHNRSMLNGICREAVELLKDKPIALQSLRELKKVKPVRQIEMAELMVTAGTYGSSYAKALLIATPKEHLAQPEKPKKIPGIASEDLVRMEHELRVVEKDFALLDETYGHDVMDLTLARGYVKRLLDNGKVVRYLVQRHGDVLAEFQRIVDEVALDTG